MYSRPVFDKLLNISAKGAIEFGSYLKTVKAMITMDTYKTPGSQPSERDRKIFNLDQNSIEPHIEEIRIVLQTS